MTLVKEIVDHVHHDSLHFPVLLVKVLPFIIDDEEISVILIRFLNSAVYLDGLGNRFIASLVAHCEKRLCSLRRSYHVDYRVVAEVPELPGGKALAPDNSVPDIFGHVSLPIHQTPIAKQNGWYALAFCKLNERIFEMDLSVENRSLKSNSLLEGELVTVDHGAALHEHCGCLWHLENPQALLFQVFTNLFDGLCFSSAWTTSDTNFKNVP